MLLKDLRITSTSSDYDSVASTPPRSFDLSYGLPVFVDANSQSTIQNFVNLLKSKFKLPIAKRQSEPSEPEASEVAPTVPPKIRLNRDEDHLASHHMYANTGPNVDPTITLAQVKLKLETIKMDNNSTESADVPAAVTPPITPPVTPPVQTVSLSRSKSYRNQRNRVFIAQRKRSGSYHILNVEDIWRHQLENRYAPVSVMRHRSPSPSKLRKGASLKSRRSYIRDRLFDSQENRSRTSITDYEVPLQMISPAAIIPPPQVIKRMSRRISRQDATEAPVMYDHRYDSLLQFNTEEVGRLGKMVSAISEPCLSSLGSNDYDYLEDVSIPPSSHNSSCVPSCMASPTKHPLERYISVPAAKISVDHSDDYDHMCMWDDDSDIEDTDCEQ